MSHISTVEIRVDDLEALADAAEHLSLELRLEQRTFVTYAGNRTPCEAAITNPANVNSYEVGVVKEGTGYRLAYDDWAGGKGMIAKTGAKCEKILVEYGVAKPRRLAKKKGWAYREERAKNGGVQCYVTPPTGWSGSQATSTSTKRW